MSNQSPFAKLAAINVNDHVEKKNGLSYLSWAWAVAKLMENDPSANWEFHEPKMFGESMMVSCTVTAFGKPVTMHLPVMNHKNQAIKNPDAFEINKNMMRCLVKAIGCHGLGLYIYAGEDLPADDDGNHPPKKAEAKKADAWETKKPEPTPPPKKVEGNGGNWNIKISDDGGDWPAAAVQGAEIALGLASGADDVLEIFKTNRTIFEKLQQEDPEKYTGLMEKFKSTKESFK